MNVSHYDVCVLFCHQQFPNTSELLIIEFMLGIRTGCHWLSHAKSNTILLELIIMITQYTYKCIYILSSISSYLFCNIAFLLY